MDVLKDRFTPIGEILKGKFTGKNVNVRGWVHRTRTGGGIAFVVIRDSSGVIQCALKQDEVGKKAWEKATGIFIESSVTASGVVREDKRAPGGYEIGAADFDVVCRGEPFPIAKDKSIEFLLDTRHLWLRSQRLSSIMKARHHVVGCLKEFFNERGFWELAPPIITKAGCEGGATLFGFDYFGEKAYLTQSGQLYAEVFITALEKAYVLAPSFRAEKSRTVRHLAEYWHLEPEMAYYDNEMSMKLQEEMICYVCKKLAKEHEDLLTSIGRNPADLLRVTPPFERMTYAEAVKRLCSMGMNVGHGNELGADEEKALTKDLKKPIFITNFPKSIGKFYMREDPKNPGTVLNSDMLAPEGHGEIIGGSERIWDYDELMKRIKEEKLDVRDYQWYVDLRKYGSVPHSGFGLGIERLVKWILNLDHIRDAIPFPRTINRVYP